MPVPLGSSIMCQNYNMTLHVMQMKLSLDHSRCLTLKFSYALVYLHPLGQYATCQWLLYT